MTGPEHLIEFFHGYTYSAHPLACAAALGTLDTYAEEGLLTRAREDGAVLRERAAFAQGPAARDRRPQHRPGRRHRARADRRRSPASARSTCSSNAASSGVLIRTTGDTIALSPPLIIEQPHIDQIVGTIADVLKQRRLNAAASPPPSRGLA